MRTTPRSGEGQVSRADHAIRVANRSLDVLGDIDSLVKQQGRFSAAGIEDRIIAAGIAPSYLHSSNAYSGEPEGAPEQWQRRMSGQLSDWTAEDDEDDVYDVGPDLPGIGAEGYIERDNAGFSPLYSYTPNNDEAREHDEENGYPYKPKTQYGTTALRYPTLPS